MQVAGMYVYVHVHGPKMEDVRKAYVMNKHEYGRISLIYMYMYVHESAVPEWNNIT